MIKMLKKKLKIDESLVSRLNVICEFCHIKPNIINGCIRKIEHTNLSYIESHKLIINNTTFLAFNYSKDIYINNLSKKNKNIRTRKLYKNIQKIN